MPNTTIEKILARADDVELMRKLDRVLTQHEQELSSRQWVEDLIANSATSEAAKLLEKAAAAGQLRYGSKDWVPDPFQQLEDHHLVACEVGAKDLSGHQPRTISITSRGVEVAKRIKDLVHA